MKFSIIVPTYNHVDLLKTCLNSIFEYTDLSDGEIIVVANGCVDGTRDYLSSLPDVIVKVVWSDEPLGYSGATNAGISLARGEYFILLNDDASILPHPKHGWVNELLAHFSDPTVAVTGPLMLQSAETKSSFIVFFCAAVARRVMEKIGTLNEMFGVGFGEDMEFCWRAERAGYKVLRVPIDSVMSWDTTQNLHVCHFPIFHKGEATVGDYDGQRIVRENTAKLAALVRSREPLQPVFGPVG